MVLLRVFVEFCSPVNPTRTRWGRGTETGGKDRKCSPENLVEKAEMIDENVLA